MENMRVIAAFRGCREYGRVHKKAIGKLPEDMVIMILDPAGPSFETHWQRWPPLLECYQNDCEPSKLYSEEEVKRASREYPGLMIESDLRYAPLHRDDHARARAEVHNMLDRFI